MDKIYLKDNYIVTELSGVTAVFPKNYSSYSENASGFYINNTFPVNNQRAVYIDFTRVASVYNEAGTTAYTIATLRSFLLTNTGFKSPSGGSGGVWGSITGTLSSQTDLQSALNAKENTITAGTTSQYYRGDKTFQTLDKTAVGLGNVDNTSDLNKPISTLTQTALNAKQDTLTLTTTGTSGAATLVGSTLNIPQYSGGGAASGGFNTPVKLGSGGIYSNIPNGASNSTTALGSNTMYLAPFIPAQTFTISDFKINVAVSGGGNYRILLYSHSNTNGLPDFLLYESSDLSTSTGGVKTAITTQSFTAGITYWLGVYGSGAAQFAAVVVASLNQIGMDSTLAQQYSSITRGATFGSAPNPFGTTHTKSSASFIRIGLTVA